MNIDRARAEAVRLHDRRVVQQGPIGMTRDHLGTFARTPTPDDQIVTEARVNTAAEVMGPFLGGVLSPIPSSFA
jgi:hypothetical protein